MATTTIPPEILKQLQERGLMQAALLAGLPVTTKHPSDIYLDKLLTVYEPLITIKTKVRKFAPFNIPVLILGETGTGKELIAQALHGNRKGKFVPVNCAGIPDTLLESEFFGCVKGAFTGAGSDRDGYIREAQDGTLFLDEIGEMPALLQSKLLRFLESKRYRPVGSVKELESNARLVSATNRLNLDECGKEFRLDLYYRLAGTCLKLPSLCERGMDDVELLIKTFSKVPREQLNLPSIGMFKGNVRQLLNLVEENNLLCQS